MKRPRLPLRPKHAERICWGCDRYCPSNDMACFKDRSLHPIELFGNEWIDDEKESSEGAD